MEINLEEIKKLVALLMERHGEELKLIASKYGDDAVNVVAGMFKDEKAGSDKYYDAIQGKTLGELLNESGKHFIKAREQREEFKNFLNGIGSIAGSIIKSAVVSAIKK